MECAKEEASKRFQVEEGYGQTCIFNCSLCRTRHREEAGDGCRNPLEQCSQPS